MNTLHCVQQKSDKETQLYSLGPVHVPIKKTE